MSHNPFSLLNLCPIPGIGLFRQGRIGHLSSYKMVSSLSLECAEKQAQKTSFEDVVMKRLSNEY